jgi:hypothetical protein
MIDFSTQIEGEIPEGLYPEVQEGELVPFDYTNQLALAKRPLDLILMAIRQDFEAYQADLDALVEKALALHVIDEASDQEAVRLGTEAQGFKGKIEKLTEYVVDEPNSFVTGVRGLKNGFTKTLTNDVMGVVAKKRDVFLAVDRKKKEALRFQAEKEARELQDRLNREAREKAEAEAKRLAEEEAHRRGVTIEQVEVVIAPIEEVFIPTPVVEQTKTTVQSKTGSGTGFQRKHLYIEVTDFAKIDDKYKVLAESVIKDDFKSGTRDFAGLIVEEREKSQFRSK